MTFGSGAKNALLATTRQPLLEWPWKESTPIGWEKLSMKAHILSDKKASFLTKLRLLQTSLQNTNILLLTLITKILHLYMDVTNMVSSGKVSMQLFLAVQSFLMVSLLEGLNRLFNHLITITMSSGWIQGLSAGSKLLQLTMSWWFLFLSTSLCGWIMSGQTLTLWTRKISTRNFLLLSQQGL